MAEGTKPLFTNYRTGKPTPIVVGIGTASITNDQLVGTYLTAIGTGSVSNAQLANMPPWTIKINNTTVSAAPQDLRIDELTQGLDPTEAGDFLLGGDANQELRKFSTRLVGGLHFLNAGVATSQATLDIALTDYTSYRGILIKLSNIIPETDDSLGLQLSTDGGATYDAGASDYEWAIIGNRSGNVTQNSGDTADSVISITGTSAFIESTSSGITTSIEIMNQADATKTPFVRSDSVVVRDTPQIAIMSGAGRRLNAQDTNAVRFIFTTASIASGSWALYGYV